MPDGTKRRRGAHGAGDGERRRRLRIVLLAATAVALVAAMVAFNPLTGGPTPMPAGPSVRDTAGGSAGGSDDDAAPGADAGFDGDAAAVAEQVRALLNSPADLPVDTLSALLYRHGDVELAEARDVFDAIGRMEDDDTVRALARTWYEDAMAAGAAARLEDLSSGLDGALEAARLVGDLGLDDVDGCSSLADAADGASRLVAEGSGDYGELTDAQAALTSALGGCAAGLDAEDRTAVFGEPQGVLEGDE